MAGVYVVEVTLLLIELKSRGFQEIKIRTGPNLEKKRKTGLGVCVCVCVFVCCARGSSRSKTECAMQLHVQAMFSHL